MTMRAAERPEEEAPRAGAGVPQLARGRQGGESGNRLHSSEERQVR